MSALDVAPAEFMRLPTGKHRLACPWCRKGVHDDALEIRATDRSVTWECFRCGATGWAWREEQRSRDWRASAPPPQPKAANADDKVARARALVACCIPARGTLAETYLRSRRLESPQRGDLYDERSLLFRGEAYHWPSASRLPAMVAPITDVMSNDVIGAHTTFLKPDGSAKAEVEKPRLYLGKKTGGAVKLTPDAEVTMGLAIGEGIETCLVALMAGYSTWAALDAGNLAGFPVLPGIEALTVLADHDEAGMKAAQAVAQRWAEAGREARILAPPNIRTDWNDQLAGGAHA